MHSHDQNTEHKSFVRPEEVRNFPKGRAEILKVGGAEVGRLTFEPGWRWSNDIKPLAKTSSCEAPHFQYHVSGKLAIRMDDGTEFIAGPGDITSLPMFRSARFSPPESTRRRWSDWPARQEQAIFKR